jgi:DNA mismatch endonuclease (patch repair protein)
VADVFTKKKRSEVMARIRGRGNKETELALASLLRRNGLTGWRRHQAILGRPDFVFRKERLAVFVDGCFWHGCKLHANVPSNNRRFWVAKLSANRVRDNLVSVQLRRVGWRVVRIWEHELRSPHRVIRRIDRALRSPRKDAPR